MVYVKISAGLCNQMYFFATAYALAKEWGEELVIDVDIDGNMEWTYLLDEFQMPSYKKIIYPIRYRVGKEYAKITSWLKEKVAIIDESYFEQDGEYLTIPKEKILLEFPGKDIYLKGTFLMRQMFTKYLPDLQKIFTLKTPSPFIQEFEKRIADVTAIGVHIRRQGFAILGDSNGIDFFMAAIVYMRQCHKNAKFFIFSDELDYVKENLGTADDIFYIDAMNGYKGDIEEFICLTKCHHYILTRRSTYGRMAEILNPSDRKTSVLYGENTWNDSEDRFIFLPYEDVQVLSQRFEKNPILFLSEAEKTGKQIREKNREELAYIGLDSGGVSAAGRKDIIFQKIKLCAEKGDYGQAVHLCRLLEDQFGGYNTEGFHEYFGDLLYKSGKIREAIVEYIYEAKKREIQKDVFKKGKFECYQKLLKRKKGKHYIIAQYGMYTSQYLSQMQMIGLILVRMGNDVSFIFKRGKAEVSKELTNALMVEWNNRIDSKWMELILQNGFSAGRFYYGYPCYDYTDILQNKIANLEMAAAKFPDRETILVGRDPEIISSDVPFQKVFVDFSEPFDESYLTDDVGKREISQMYECAEIVVTRDKNYSNGKQKVIRMDDTLLAKEDKYSMAEIPCCEPTLFTDDYLDIALKIDLNCE